MFDFTELKAKRLLFMHLFGLGVAAPCKIGNKEQSYVNNNRDKKGARVSNHKRDSNKKIITTLLNICYIALLNSG